MKLENEENKDLIEAYKEINDFIKYLEKQEKEVVEK